MSALADAPAAATGTTLRRIGVVVPIFGHSRFVAEAIESACRQDTSILFTVLAVDDGCPSRETQGTLAACRRRFPSRFRSVRQRNGGLSAARNAGVRALLALHPDLDAVFFLDADNRLEPYALESYAAALTSDERAGWAFPDVHAFGLTPFAEGVDVRETAIADSPFRHLRGNICEAGSLVRAEVFRRGVFFDETMRSGLEDWDFWLSAREAGFHGVRVKDSGFLYRVRPESMVAQSRRETDEILAGMRRRHAKLFSRRAVMAAEHREAPRFLMADLETGVLRATSDPLAPGRRMTLGETAALFRAHLRAINEEPFPAVIVAHHGMAASAAEWPLHLRGLLFDALARPLEGPAVLQVQASDHASRFPGDPRHVRRIAERGQAMIALIPVAELYRLQGERPKRPGLAVLRDTDWTEYWTVPITEGAPPATAKTKRRTERLSALLRPLTRVSSVPPMRPAGRLYRGPIVADVRAKVTDALCGFRPYPPYPATGAERRGLVCVAPETLRDAGALQAFAEFCERLRGAGLALSLQIDGQTRNESLAPALGCSAFDNVVLNPEPFRPEPAFSYLGSALPVDDPGSHDRQMAIIRAHDVLACFGICRPSTLLGEAKGDGVVTLSAVPDALAGEARRDGPDILTVVAAYEHAHHMILAGNASRTALRSRGVPASRFVTGDRLGFAIRTRLAGRP